MSMLAHLAEAYPEIPASCRLKAALLFAGVRYHRSLSEAADWAFPNYLPHHLQPGEPPFRGSRVAPLPYMLLLDDGTHLRLRVKPDSPFRVEPVEGPSKFVLLEGERPVAHTSFEPRYPWMEQLTADGTSMRSTGLSQHGDMLVLNAAPGCEYFVVPGGGRSENLHCRFCLYGLPDKARLEPLGQKLYETVLPESTLARVTEACSHAETHAGQIYIVGGSMLDWNQEGDRYVQIAERLRDAGLCERYYVVAGSGALPRRHLERLAELGVRGACFNMEVWDTVQFARVCPGKARFVGRDRWLESLDQAAQIFGRGHVMTAMVGGAELEGEGGFTTADEALASAFECGEHFIPRGINPLYSIYWKVTGKERGEEPIYTLDLFLRLNQALAELRQRYELPVNPDFLTRAGAYMQLEPDYDWALGMTPDGAEAQAPV